MTDEANLNLPQVVRITADIPAGVASQLSEVATLMNANRITALHEAIVLTNLLYSEAAKRGKVVVPKGACRRLSTCLRYHVRLRSISVSRRAR